MTRPPQYLAERYRLKEELGSGGFATVYLGYDERLEREVAIKCLHPEQVKNINNLERFLREARTAARLQHAAIVQVYDFGHEQGWHYIIMEYINGMTLRNYLEETGGAIPVDEAISLTYTLLQSLDYAHSQGVIHRDIKPENVMLTSDGLAKLTDFGLALRDTDLRLTESHSFVGTIYYLAPEALQGQSIDHRVDLYAIGAMLFELITARPPFEGETISQIISNILKSDVQFPTTNNALISQNIANVIQRLLAKNPDERYQSAVELLSALPNADDLRETQSLTLRESAKQKLQLSHLERIVRNSSDSYPKTDNETLAVQGSGQQLLLFAAQGDTVNALEIERRRIAAMLEEFISGQISLILSQIHAYEGGLGDNPQTKMALSVLSTLIRDLSQQVHDIETNLYPAVLQTLGLEPALEEFINQQRRAYGIKIQMSLQRLRERLPNAVELILFRTTQDVVERAVKRANASVVIIELKKENNHLIYRVEDDGQPPNPTTLHTSRQRISALGAVVTIGISRYKGLSLLIEFDMTPPVELTEREMDVIELIAEGLTNKEIGAILHIATRTVKFHLDNIFSKLGVNTRTEAAIYAVHHGWVRGNTPTE